MIATFEELKRSISNKQFRPIYFLCGQESFFIDTLVEKFEKEVLKPEEQAFNQTILYGNEITIAQLTDTAKRFPMMSEKQLVIVKEAQQLKDWELLSSYFDHFQPSTVLVIAYKGALDKRKAIYKQIAKHPTVLMLDATPLYENKIPDWIVKYVKSKRRDISLKSATIISDQLGNTLTKIVNEIDKLLLVVPKGGQITEQIIEYYVGIHREFNNFEYITAISKKDILKATRIANYLASSQKSNPLTLTLSLLYKFFNTLLTYHYEKRNVSSTDELSQKLGILPSKISEYTIGSRHYHARRCVEILSLIRQYDMLSKGVPLNRTGSVSRDSGDILKELTARILIDEK